MSLEAIELHFSSTEESAEDKLGDNNVIWKDVLREGRFAITPGLGKRLPFEVISQGPSRPEDRVISMSDLIDSYDERAFEDVTIPDGHPDPEKGTDSALNNTGYVRGLRVVRKKGQHYLQAAMGFTEPDVLAKVKRGTVPNVSSGVLLNFTRKADGKKFKAALNHVALARTGWINDLEPFKRVFASDDVTATEGDDTINIQEVQFDDSTDNQGGDGGSESADVIWNEADGASWVSKGLMTALNPEPSPSPVDELRPQAPKAYYSVVDVSQTKNVALVDEFFKGETSRWVIPFEVKDDKVEPGPERRWTKGKEALIAASDDNFNDRTTEVVTEKLNAALNDLEGVDDFEVVRVSMDQRCRIANMKTGTSFEASFALLPEGQVFLSDPSEWNRVQAVNLEDKPEQKPPAPEPQKVTSLFNQDTPEGRVAAARQRRRRMIAGKSN